MRAGKSSCVRFQWRSMSQIVTLFRLAPASVQISAAPIPIGGAYRYPWEGSKCRLPAAEPLAIAGTGRGATKAFCEPTVG